ncbi:hypothetical protein BGZ74_011471 [Mortierella antarctica]|nr:hypothetical protein BGZ74_011471 [Mortierella antarctica]
MKGISLPVATKGDVTKAGKWAMACRVLHNFILLPDNAERDDAEENLAATTADLPQAGDDEPPVVADLAGGQDDLERRAGSEKRNKLKTWVLRNQYNITISDTMHL